MLEIVVLIFTHMFVACLFWAVGYDQGRGMGKRLQQFKHKQAIDEEFEVAWEQAKKDALDAAFGNKKKAGE